MKSLVMAGLVAATTTTMALVGAAPSAQAFSFTTNYSTDSTGGPPQGNIWLESVEFDGITFTDFVLIDKAKIVFKPPYTGGNSGAASSDHGDNADGTAVEDPTPDDLVAILGNLNLNNIVDTEDRGKFTIDFRFDRRIESLFFWERGMNSRIQIQALDKDRNLIGTALSLFSGDFDYAGFDLDTTEIVGAQPVGSRGIRLAELGVTEPIRWIRVTGQPSYNGPDYKIIGGSAGVPEPTTMLGLALAGAGLAYSRRRRQVAS